MKSVWVGRVWYGLELRPAEEICAVTSLSILEGTSSSCWQTVGPRYAFEPVTLGARIFRRMSSTAFLWTRKETSIRSSKTALMMLFWSCTPGRDILVRGMNILSPFTWQGKFPGCLIWWIGSSHQFSLTGKIWSSMVIKDLANCRYFLVLNTYICELLQEA